MAHRRKVVTTDASNKSWGALCEGKPNFGLWSEKESGLHINCLEMLAVCQACQFFLPDIRVLVCSDSRSVVSYINNQGGLILKRLCMLANDLLVWAQSALTEGDICARQDEPWSRHVDKEQRILLSLKRMARYGIHGLSYGPCMCGHSTGAFWTPRACPKHDGRS